MNPNKSTSTLRLLTLGLLMSLLWVGVAQAAPLYRGKFTLPHSVRWGQAVLPAGDYQLRFEDVSKARVFVVIQDMKSHEDVAYLPAITAGEAQGENVLLITKEGDQLVVQSLRLGELGVAFTYEPTRVRGTNASEEARTVQAIPVTEAKK